MAHACLADLRTRKIFNCRKELFISDEQRKYFMAKVLNCSNVSTPPNYFRPCGVQCVSFIELITNKLIEWHHHKRSPITLAITMFIQSNRYSFCVSFYWNFDQNNDFCFKSTTTLCVYSPNLHWSFSYFRLGIFSGNIGSCKSEHVFIIFDKFQVCS